MTDHIIGGFGATLFFFFMLLRVEWRRFEVRVLSRIAGGLRLAAGNDNRTRGLTASIALLSARAQNNPFTQVLGHLITGAEPGGRNHGRV